jgi:hypothetical protein
MLLQQRMKTGYSVYPFIVTELTRAYRKGHKLGKKTADLVPATLNNLFRDPRFCEMQLAATVMDEVTQWAENRVVFVETAELAELIEKANFDICEESFFTPHQAFAICFPTEMNLPGCVVLCQGPEERQRAIDRINRKYGPDIRIHTPRPERVLSMNYVVERVSFRICVPVRLIPESLKGPKQMEDAIGFLDGRDSIALPPEQLKAQHRLLRLICGLCVYIRAFPEALRAGYPAEMTKEVKDPYMPTAKPFTIHAPVRHGHEGPREHYRKWHFRSLRDERYKRDAEGRVRIVFVRDTIVGGKVVPETVTKT